MRELLTKYLLAMITASIAKYIADYNDFFNPKKSNQRTDRFGLE